MPTYPLLFKSISLLELDKLPVGTKLYRPFVELDVYRDKPIKWHIQECEIRKYEKFGETRVGVCVLSDYTKTWMPCTFNGPARDSTRFYQTFDEAVSDVRAVLVNLTRRVSAVPLPE